MLDEITYPFPNFVGEKLVSGIHSYETFMSWIILEKNRYVIALTGELWGMIIIW